MKRFASIALVLLSLASPTAAQETLERIVAVVNDDVVLASELETELQQARRRMSQREMSMPPADELRRQVLDRLIMRRLQLNRAERLGIAVDSASLDAAVRRVAQQNDMTLSQFRDALARQDMTMRDIRERLRRELTLQRLRRQQMRRRVNVTDQEIDQYIEQNSGDNWEYNLSHILISAPEGASPKQLEQAREKAEDLKAELGDGGEFDTLAATWSDSRTALEGGEMGWRVRGEVADPLAERLPDMEPGEVTDVLQTPSGFHLFKLNDRRRQEREVVTQKRLRHILIEANDVVTDDDARDRLQSLRQRMTAGDAEFAELARANSDDPDSASKGGDMGWHRPGALPPNLEEQVRRLDAGEVSQPFRSRLGWHIVEITDVRDKDVTEKTLRRDAQQAIRERKRGQEMELWLRQLRDEAYIDIRLPSAS
jgi:peptidyl-prolyl cis-trans isomerase SurA